MLWQALGNKITQHIYKYSVTDSILFRKNNDTINYTCTIEIAMLD